MLRFQFRISHVVIVDMSGPGLFGFRIEDAAFSPDALFHAELLFDGAGRGVGGKAQERIGSFAVFAKAHQLIASADGQAIHSKLSFVVSFDCKETLSIAKMPVAAV